MKLVGNVYEPLVLETDNWLPEEVVFEVDEKQLAFMDCLNEIEKLELKKAEIGWTKEDIAEYEHYVEKTNELCLELEKSGKWKVLD